jgi:ParB family chromosome partitioning protein
LVLIEPLALASLALAELRSGLDESQRSGADATFRFDLFRSLSNDSRAARLGSFVARSLEASLNMTGERRLPIQDHLGSLSGIDLFSRFASVKKGDLAMSA